MKIKEEDKNLFVMFLVWALIVGACVLLVTGCKTVPTKPKTFDPKPCECKNKPPWCCQDGINYEG